MVCVLCRRSSTTPDVLQAARRPARAPWQASRCSAGWRGRRGSTPRLWAGHPAPPPHRHPSAPRQQGCSPARRWRGWAPPPPPPAQPDRAPPPCRQTPSAAASPAWQGAHRSRGRSPGQRAAARNPLHESRRQLLAGCQRQGPPPPAPRALTTAWGVLLKVSTVGATSAVLSDRALGSSSAAGSLHPSRPAGRRRQGALKRAPRGEGAAGTAQALWPATRSTSSAAAAAAAAAAAPHYMCPRRTALVVHDASADLHAAADGDGVAQPAERAAPLQHAAGA